MNFNGLQPPPEAAADRSPRWVTLCSERVDGQRRRAAAWLIGGGSLVANDSGTYAFNVNKNGQLSGFTMESTDLPNHAAPSLVQDTSFTLFDGVVMQISTGVNVAHYLVDKNGTARCLLERRSPQSITNSPRLSRPNGATP